MKKVLLIIAGLAILNLNGFSQPGKGNGKGKSKAEAVSKSPKGKANGHYKSKGEPTVKYSSKSTERYDQSRRGNSGYNQQTQVYRSSKPQSRNIRVDHHVHRPVYHTTHVYHKDSRYRGNRTVYISHSPGIRYVRHVNITPRAYVYVNIEGRRVRSNILTVEDVDWIAWEMAQARFDDEKLDIARDLIRGNMVYAEDVAYLMQELRFEENRLRLAKFAHRRTVDKRNYAVVFDQLEFRSSRRELDRFIYNY